MRRAAAALILVASLTPLAAQPALALFAYIHVNTAADEDSSVDGLCSLREAIIATNAGGTENECTGGNTGIDRILIDVSPVNVTSQLPTIYVPVIMYSNLGGPRAEIHGPGSGTAFLFGNATSDGTSITNLFIDNFATAIKNGGSDMTIASNVIGPNSESGIYLSGGSVTVGGANPRTPGACSGDCNRIAGNGYYGIYGSMDGSITGNLIGLDANGTSAQPNGHGIDVGGTITIGGATADARNVVSGNTTWGIGLGPGCTCTVRGNYVGTNAAGTGAVPNGTGVWTEGQMSNSFGVGATTVIGGTNAGEGNVISGNTAAGIFADKWGQYDSLKIQGNSIGVGSGAAALGNGGDGIVLGNGDPDWVTHVYIGDPYTAAASNTIAFNGAAGVRLSGQFATGDYIIDNSIHDNAGKGISLLGGADDNIPAPTITGTNPVAGTACASCQVDVYSDSADEGRKYEGYTVADGSGNWSFSGTPIGPNVTATAVTTTRGTSEFSTPMAIVAYKPDGRIKKGSGSLIGNNIYNLTGLNQTKSGSQTPGNTVKFGISIQNDSTTSDHFLVSAAGTTATGFTIKYFHGTTDITAAVVAGTYATPALTTGSTWLITAKVKVSSSAAVGSSINRLVTITSAGDGAKQDAVKFVVSRK